MCYIWGQIQGANGHELYNVRATYRSADRRAYTRKTLTFFCNALYMCKRIISMNVQDVCMHSELCVWEDME